MNSDDDCADGTLADAVMLPAGAAPDGPAVLRPGPSKDETKRPGQARESLEHGEHGRFVVVTESGSRYLIDLTRQVFVRLPKDGEEHLWAMRGDGHPVRLLRLVECVVGRRMQLRLDLGIPGIAFTDRQTTTVLAIAEVPDGAEGRELDILNCAFGRGRDIVPAAVERPDYEEEPMDSVEELTGDEGGVWRVTTLGSSHILNFQRGTVTRIPGVGRNPSINDRERPLRSIESCKVGEAGHWTMQSDDFFTAYFWHQTSTIQRIERLTGLELGKANTEVALENINASDGLLRAADVAAMLDVSVDDVQEMFETHRLLGLIWKDRLVFPGSQFGRDQNEVDPFVQPLIEAAFEQNQSMRSIIFWLYSPTTYFGGARPVDYTDEPERLVETFRRSAGVEW